jgi:NH3-dependent NAD+ synthetase
MAKRKRAAHDPHAIPSSRNLAAAVNELGENIDRPNQVKLTLSNEEKQCLDILRLAKGLTTSNFLRQQIRDAYHAYQATLAHPNGNGAAQQAKHR